MISPAIVTVQTRLRNFFFSMAGQDISVVRHYLLGELTTIHLYAESLLSGDQGPLTEQQREYLSTIHKTALTLVDYLEKTKHN